MKLNTLQIKSILGECDIKWIALFFSVIKFQSHLYVRLFTIREHISIDYLRYKIKEKLQNEINL